MIFLAMRIMSFGELPCIATGEPFTGYNGSLSSVRSQSHFANDTGVEVLSRLGKKIQYFQYGMGYSPNRRSHEVWRVLALRDCFMASWRRRQCSAHPA